MHALALELEYITVGVNNLLDHWEIVIATHRNGSFWVLVASPYLLPNFGWFATKSDAALSSFRDRLKEFAYHNSPQVVRNPYRVKFIYGNSIGTLYLDYDSLSKYDVGYMIKVSTLLRTKGFSSKAKSDIDIKIIDYCDQKKIHAYFRKMKNVNRSHQPADFWEDHVDEEVQYRLALANERGKLGELVVPEEPIRDEPPTPVHPCSDLEEGEVAHSE